MGKEVVIELDASPGEVFTGTIAVVNPMVDPNSRTFKVKIEFPNPDFKLESGMFSRVRIIDLVSYNTLLIPRRVIIEDGTVKKVFVVEDNRAAEKAITTGIVNYPLVEVKTGLKENDIVVTEGFYSLKNGIKVNIKELSFV